MCVCVCVCACSREPESVYPLFKRVGTELVLGLFLNVQPEEQLFQEITHLCTLHWHGRIHSYTTYATHTHTYCTDLHTHMVHTHSFLHPHHCIQPHIYSTHVLSHTHTHPQTDSPARPTTGLISAPVSVKVPLWSSGFCTALEAREQLLDIIRDKLHTHTQG